MHIIKVTRAVLVLACLAPVIEIRAAQNQPPVPIVREEPVYPYAMRKKGIGGKVVVEFIIGADGLVKQANVVQSTHEGFEYAAVRAVLGWRFKPGVKDGKTVNVRAQQILEFSMPKRKLAYPYALLREGKEGKATIGYWLDEKKQLSRSIVLRETDPAFGKAAQAMLADEMATTPESITSPSKGMFQTTCTFLVKDSGDSALEILKILRKKTLPFTTESELDVPLEALSRDPPLFPAALRETSPTGTAVVEFFVDRKGLAQIPRVISASHADFGYAAAQAVAQWQFKPPVHKGKPVIARTQVTLEFNLLEPKKEKEESAR